MKLHASIRSIRQGLGDDIHGINETKEASNFARSNHHNHMIRMSISKHIIARFRSLYNLPVNAIRFTA